MTKTGPYDASHVVWALGESFFILFNTNNFFIVSIESIYGIRKRERAGMPGTTKKGPNDTRHVVWALVESFFFFSSYYLTNIFFIVSIRSIYRICERERAGMPRMTKKDPH